MPWFISPVDVAPNSRGRSESINNLDAAVEAAFSKLPAEAVSGKGFSEPIKVGSATDPSHAVTLQQILGLGIPLLPLSVASGGTGADDPGEALTNLGGTAIGQGIFTAADAAAVNTLLGLGSAVNLAKLNVAQTFTATQVADNGTAAVSTTSTYTFDGADQIRTITLTNAITVTFGAPTGITPNAYYTFRLLAGDTAARTFAWNAAYKFPAATAPLAAGTITNGASDIITFIGGASNTLLYVGHQADVR